MFNYIKIVRTPTYVMVTLLLTWILNFLESYVLLYRDFLFNFKIFIGR